MNGSSPSLWSAVRGPIMLITLGSLFAIDYAGGFRFSRTWPVLAIVYGALKLAEHFVPRDHPKAGGV